MAEITFTLESADVEHALDKTTPTVRARTLDVSQQTANQVASEARGRVARRTGATLASIRTVPTKDGYGYLVVASHVGRFLEFGTIHMRPRPFLLVSARLEAPRFPARVADAVQDGIDTVGLGG